jgi:hypothetical protein
MNEYILLVLWTTGRFTFWKVADATTYTGAKEKAAELMEADNVSKVTVISASECADKFGAY